jgi:hypothetical protein
VFTCESVFSRSFEEAQKPAQTENPGLREKESVSSLFRLNSREKEETWYPTLRKTVWVLAQLHDFVQPAIFEDIAQESLALCRISLVSAAENVKLRSKVDGELFLVRHLFVLKEIATGLGLAQRVDASAGNAAGSSAGAEAGGVTGEPQRRYAMLIRNVDIVFVMQKHSLRCSLARVHFCQMLCSHL